MKDYYVELGVEESAGEEEIKRAYRKLAKQYHPDRNQAVEAHDRFISIAEAYAVLTDPDQRRTYDQRRKGIPVDDTLARMAEAFAKAQQMARARAEAEYQEKQKRWEAKQAEEARWGRITDITARIGLVLGLLLALDFFGAVTSSPMTILNKQKFLDRDLYLLTTAEHQYVVNAEDALYVLTGWMLEEKSSLILSQQLDLKAFPAYSPDKKTSIMGQANLYRPFFVFPLAMVICSIGAMMRRMLPRPIQGLLFAIGAWTAFGLSFLAWGLFG